VKYEISNIVATANLNTEIDPKVAIEFLRTAGEVTYEPRRFPGLVVKLGGNVIILLFKTGKMVVTGREI